jgi:hypothetical protein
MPCEVTFGEDKREKCIEKLEKILSSLLLYNDKRKYVRVNNIDDDWGYIYCVLKDALYFLKRNDKNKINDIVENIQKMIKKLEGAVIIKMDKRENCIQRLEEIQFDLTYDDELMVCVSVNEIPEYSQNIYSAIQEAIDLLEEDDEKIKNNTIEYLQKLIKQIKEEKENNMT